ncbi:MAG: hypothetical protein RJA81_1500, partial [Planctomycetota bacterium]
MNFTSLKRIPLGLGLALFAALSIRSFADHHEAKSLFNGKDLTGWTIWIRHNDKTVDPRED